MPRCAACGHVSAEEFKFCPECGVPAAAAAREERKTVTVLFCDIVGSTELGERLDPESVRNVLARDYGTELGLRVGINTGEVVTGTKERLATGDAVNVAARLEQSAGAGQILLGETTLERVRDAVVAERLPDLDLKGKSEAVRAWELQDVRADEGRRLSAVPMVGREHELGVL